MNYTDTMTAFIRMATKKELKARNLDTSTLEKNDKIKKIFGEDLTISLGEYNLSREQRIELIKSSRIYWGKLKKLFTPEEIEGNLTLSDEVVNLSGGIEVIKKKGYRIRKTLRDNKKEIGNLYNNLLRRIESLSNQISLTGTLYATIDPREFLTCSYNTYGWTSCYNPSGEYNSAPILMTSHSQTIMFFISTKLECLLDTEVHDKKWRAFVYVDSRGAFQLPALPFVSSDLIKKRIGNFLCFDTCEESCYGREIKTDILLDFMDDIEEYEAVFYNKSDAEKCHVLVVHNDYRCPVCGKLVRGNRSFKGLCKECSIK